MDTVYKSKHTKYTKQKKKKIIYIHISWVVPPPSNSGKWRVSSGSSTENIVVLVVTGILGRGTTQYVYINIYIYYICICIHIYIYIQLWELDKRVRKKIKTHTYAKTQKNSWWTKILFQMRPSLKPTANAPAHRPGPKRKGSQPPPIFRAYVKLQGGYFLQKILFSFTMFFVGVQLVLLFGFCSHGESRKIFLIQESWNTVKVRKISSNTWQVWRSNELFDGVFSRNLA